MASKNKAYGIWSKQQPIAFGTGWMVRLERAAFGWQLEEMRTDQGSYETEEERDAPVYDEDGHRVEGLTAKQKYTKKHNTSTRVYKFERIKPYSNNIFFVLSEFLYNIYSFIRFWIMSIAGSILKYLIIPLILLVIFGFDEIRVMLQYENNLTILLLLLVIYAAPSFLFAAIGYGLRALFGIDKKVERELEENGLNPNWRGW